MQMIIISKIETMNSLSFHSKFMLLSKVLLDRDKYFFHNSTSSVATLESICAGFGLTLAQFFAEGELVELSQEQKGMFAAWAALTREQKEVLFRLISVMKR